MIDILQKSFHRESFQWSMILARDLVSDNYFVTDSI